MDPNASQVDVIFRDAQLRPDGLLHELLLLGRQYGQVRVAGVSGSLGFIGKLDPNVGDEP
ncbi:hypothetical protein D3C87_1613840 [compost metagenome]